MGVVVPVAISIAGLALVIVTEPWRDSDPHRRDASALLAACCLAVLLAALAFG